MIIASSSHPAGVGTPLGERLIVTTRANSRP